MNAEPHNASCHQNREKPRTPAVPALHPSPPCRHQHRRKEKQIRMVKHIRCAADIIAPHITKERHTCKRNRKHHHDHHARANVFSLRFFTINMPQHQHARTQHHQRQADNCQSKHTIRHEQRCADILIPHRLEHAANNCAPHVTQNDKNRIAHPRCSK